MSDNFKVAEKPSLRSRVATIAKALKVRSKNSASRPYLRENMIDQEFEGGLEYTINAIASDSDDNEELYSEEEEVEM